MMKNKIIKRLATIAMCGLLFSTATMTVAAYSIPSLLHKGTIKGDGVRLWSVPNNYEGVVLQLMYAPEEVHYNREYMVPNYDPDYRYTKRVSSGVCGWCHDDFIRYAGNL